MSYVGEQTGGHVEPNFRFLQVSGVCEGGGGDACESENDTGYKSSDLTCAPLPEGRRNGMERGPLSHVRSIEELLE